MGSTRLQTNLSWLACSGRRSPVIRNGHFRNCGLAAGLRHSITPLRATASSDVSAGIFPAGKKQAKVRIPAIHVNLTTDAILDSNAADSVESYVRGGASAIIVRDPSSGGGDLFKAAAKLKDIVRGRIPVLLEDRTDIVSATQVDGVVLTERGVPLAVARQVLVDPSYLFGVCASSPESAAAAAADGASFLVVIPPESGADPTDRPPALAPSVLTDIARASRSGMQVPVILSDAVVDGGDLGPWLSSDLDGVCGTPESLPALAKAPSSSLPEAISSLSAMLTTTATPKAASAAPSSHSGLLSGLLGNATPIDDLISREKEILSDTLAFLQEAVPEMSEARLLKDALQGLDEPFLLVVVGEFNSGKSTVINALLGAKFLEHGILPTTNEISVLKHSEGESEADKTEDGLFVRALPSELLRKLNIVDTPGTNVIIDRQQRLTEEFVPRSDLVLFIMSADRPFTESEVTFLRYIRQWGKKVVFVLNKVDIFDSEEEVAEVTTFVEDNARELLGVDAATVLPVSARQALDAKLDAGAGEQGGVLQSVDVEGSLSPDARWQASRFLALEQYMLRFLTGSEQKGASGSKGTGESTRLKLQTPLFVADALLQAAEQQLELEHTACKQEVAAVKAVESQLNKFEAEMEADGAAQRGRIRELLTTEQQRAEAAVASSLQLSNFSNLTPYVFGRDPAKTLPVASVLLPQLQERDTAAQLEDRVREHAAWIETNGTAQLRAYTDFVAARQSPGDGASAPTSSGADARSDASAATPGTAANGAASLSESDRHLNAFQGRQPESMTALSDLDTRAVVDDLEGRVRDVVVESTNTAGGALGIAIVLTAILPTALEDFLVLVLAGFFAYVSFLQWPIRRAEIKEAVGKQFGDISDELDADMRGELAQAMGKVRSQVTGMVAPLQKQAERDLALVVDRQTRLKEVQNILDSLRLEIAEL
eukprot:jgi/Ulvmu1/3319/UM155_0002.1